MLAFQRGLESKSKLTIRFEIPEEQYTAIQLWNNRKKSTSTMYVFPTLFSTFALCHSLKHPQSFEKEPLPFFGVLFGGDVQNCEQSYRSFLPPLTLATSRRPIYECIVQRTTKEFSISSTLQGMGLSILFQICWALRKCLACTKWLG